MKPIRLGWHQGLVLALGLGLMVPMAWEALNRPEFVWHECEHVYLPSIEKRFGFTGGRAKYPGYGAPYSLMHVDPSGFLGEIGFRSGDVPLSDFCGALHKSEEGRSSIEVRVANVNDWNEPPRWWDKREVRRIVVPPFPKGRSPK